MEFKEFLKLLFKHKYILIIVPLVAIIITFFLVKRLPNEYEASGQIATGIVDQSRQMLDPISSTIQEAKIDGDFSNLTEVMKLKKMMNMVSYNLLIHDLDGKEPPFRPLPKYYIHMNAADNAKALTLLRYKLQHLESLSLEDKDSYESWLYGLIVGKKYDDRTLNTGLTIARNANSDFITVSIITENAKLSAFIVNTLCQGFIDYHAKMVKLNEASALTYLTKLLEQKRVALANKMDSLQRYKIKNGILNLEEQSRSIADQKAANQEKLSQAIKDAESYRGALDNIEKRFDPKDRQYVEARVTPLNTAVTSTDEKLKQATDRWINGNFSPKLKASMDSLQKQKVALINQTSDQYINNPLLGKDDLVKQRNTLEVNYDLARYSIASIEGQIKKLEGHFDDLVPLDAKVKAYNFDIENASKEYQDALSRYNLTNLQSNSSSKLIQVEIAMPERAQPSKKMLLVILGGIGTEVAAVMFLFILFFIDDSIKNPTQLANATELPVLGYLNQISGNSIDLRKLWDVEHRDKMQQFKDLLRAVRFEVDQELDGEKVLAITSMKEGEGKTLLAISLAYSYSMINKKVLLIDGNFENPTISQTVNPKLFVEEVFKHKPGNYEPLSNTNSVMGNHGGDITLLEIGDERYIREKLNELRTIYDVIIIETPALEAMNKSKEWFLFTNKFIAVFEAGQEIANGKKALVKYLKSMDTKFAGWVLNKSQYNIKKKK
ncbi:MAG: AAA family ATPase [Bacteroidota bacterium]